jgi:Zn finger protein HypA/HybF involved in hydrogenase expression
MPTDRICETGTLGPHAERRAATPKPPPKLFECKLCGKVFDSEEEAPTCPECDSPDVEQVG